MFAWNGRPCFNGTNRRAIFRLSPIDCASKPLCCGHRLLSRQRFPRFNLPLSHFWHNLNPSFSNFTTFSINYSQNLSLQIYSKSTIIRWNSAPSCTFVRCSQFFTYSLHLYRYVTCPSSGASPAVLLFVNSWCGQLGVDSRRSRL